MTQCLLLNSYSILTHCLGEPLGCRGLVCCWWNFTIKNDGLWKEGYGRMTSHIWNHKSSKCLKPPSSEGRRHQEKPSGIIDWICCSLVDFSADGMSDERERLVPCCYMWMKCWNAEMQFYLSCFHFMMSVYGCFFSSQHPHVSCWVLSWFSHRPWHSRGCFTPNVRRLCVIGGLWQPICVEHLWLRKQNTLMVIENIDVLFSVIKKNRIKSPVNSLMVIPSWCFLVLHPSPAVVPCWMTPSYAVFYSSTPTQVTANRKNAI